VNSKQIIDAMVCNSYARLPITFVRGEGARLWDDQGREYHDFLAGIAVCALGHAHPGVARAIAEQAGQLVHVSNLFYTQPQAKVAQLLVDNSFAQRVFFCNSGAEANEGAIKLSRLWGRKKSAHTIITMQNSFHGRTMGALSATGQARIQNGFEPLLPQFKHVPYGDSAALRAAMDATVCAVMLEPVLGEGGVLLPPAGYLAEVRKICDENNALMILDEIQTGLGRSGRLFAYEHEGVAPDIMTLAKALANGLPAGAVCMGEKAADLFQPGMHASTFGAGPVVMAAAAAVLETIVKDEFLRAVESKGRRLLDGLQKLAGQYPACLAEARGLGLIAGLECKKNAAAIQQAMWERGFIINRTHETVLRFLPPLIISAAEIDLMLDNLEQVLEQQ
jgi:predicted acetylornithine/succinylornithine family transaminase